MRRLLSFSGALRLSLWRAQIGAIAIDKAWDQQPWISYSRNKTHYTRRGRRYDERPDLYRYSIIPPAVDALADAGWVENVIAPPDPHCGRQSVFRAMPALVEALGGAPLPMVKPKRRALIQLKDEQKQLIDFRDTERTDRMRRRLVDINEATSDLIIQLPADVGHRQGDLLWIGDTCLNLSNTILYRVFNGDFGHGGRFYGHWTQSVPKELRRRLTIHRGSVAEPDYEAHHLRILYALEGRQLAGDPYDIPGWERPAVKLALLILINAPTRQKAMGAIMHCLELNGDIAGRLVKELKWKHKSIEGYFHSGAGRRLQRHDSDMAERVQLGLLRRGVPALPVHDSFIVPAGYREATREQMHEAFDTVISRARGVSRLTKLDQQLEPKTTYTGIRTSLPPLPLSLIPSLSVCPFLSSLPSPPLSYVVSPLSPLSSSPSSASAFFFDHERHITPLGRVAALAAKRRRDIRQDTFADLIGVSRPTLANILAGRFGASQQTAERIAEVIASTPAFERQPFLPGLFS